MSTYLIGDVHGCYHELIALLTQVKFNPAQDVLWLTGDLVARGPDSLRVLRYVKSLGKNVRVVLGNHDLNLLAVHIGVSCNKAKDHITPLLKSNDINELIDWLRFQPLLQVDEEKRLIMAHAGIFPQWDLETAKSNSLDIEKILKSDFYFLLLNAIFSNTRNKPKKIFAEIARLRFIINAFTRMRYCFLNGEIDIFCKEIPSSTSEALKPWFNFSRMITKDYSIVFGHWASLKGKGTPRGIYALDTGCCWGEKLTCLRWEDKAYFFQASNRKIDAERSEK